MDGDFKELKVKQQAAWSSGDYAVVGVTIQLVGETLCEAMDLRAGSDVLDVAAGNGNATLAAARRFCQVTSTDWVPELLERGRARAEAEGFTVAFQVADAEALPFGDGRFGAAVSTFGVMFAPNQQTAASELMRVVRPGGKIGLACWTPGSFVGQLFKVIGKYRPPPAGVKPPFVWGTRDGIEAMFAGAAGVTTESRHFAMRFRSPEHMVDIFRRCYGPMERTFAALEAEARDGLAADFLELIRKLNRAEDGTVVVESEYLETVIVR